MAFNADTVVVAAVVGILGPSILLIGNAKISQSKQKIQWARDDALEKRRVDREKEVAKKADEAQKDNVARLRSIEDTSKIIHALVNTDLTQAYQRDLASLIDSKDLLQKVVDITIEHGGEIDPHDNHELEQKEIRITQLKLIIDTRLAHQEVIDKESSEVINKEEK